MSARGSHADGAGGGGLLVAVGGGSGAGELAEHLQPADNRWRPGADHTNNLLARIDPATGGPDYTDPTIQPFLWPR